VVLRSDPARRQSGPHRPDGPPPPPSCACSRPSWPWAFKEIEVGFSRAPAGPTFGLSLRHLIEDDLNPRRRPPIQVPDPVPARAGSKRTYEGLRGAPRAHRPLLQLGRRWLQRRVVVPPPTRPAITRIAVDRRPALCRKPGEYAAGAPRSAYDSTRRRASRAPKLDLRRRDLQTRVMDVIEARRPTGARSSIPTLPATVENVTPPTSTAMPSSWFPPATCPNRNTVMFVVGTPTTNRGTGCGRRRVSV